MKCRSLEKSIIFLLRCVKLTEIATLYCLSSDFLLFNVLDNSKEKEILWSVLCKHYA